MSAVEREGEISQRQYKGAIKSRQPTIRVDLAHRFQFHLILSRSPLLFFARCPSSSSSPLPFPPLYPRQYRGMCSLGQFYSLVLRIGNSDAKVLKFQLYEEPRRSPSGNRPLSEFDCEEIWEKSAAKVAILRNFAFRLFAKRIYILFKKRKPLK